MVDERDQERVFHVAGVRYLQAQMLRLGRKRLLKQVVCTGR
jgi:hypothetical protein